MRASRLVSLLLLLQTRGGMTAAELARELEVSVRTIHRDVEALAESGVPIYADRGPLGGIRLVEGYRTRLTGMTAEEAQALFLSGLPGPAAELGLGTVVAAARLKVLAALPAELRGRASRLVERFHLDTTGWFQAGEPVPFLADLADAVWEAERVEIDYDRGDRTVTRLLEPLGLVLKGGVWYVVGGVDGQVRTYRGSRMLRVTPTNERFERPDGFELGAFWSESSAAYERDAPRVEVTLRLPPDRLERLTGAVGAHVVNVAERLPEPDPEGWIRLRLRIEWPDSAPAALLAVGSDLEVLEPVDLRERIVRHARRVLDRYGASEPPVPTAGARPVQPRARRASRGAAGVVETGSA